MTIHETDRSSLGTGDADEATRQVLAAHLSAIGELPDDRIRRQFIPTEPDLWRSESFPLFVERRNTLIAQGINDYLDDITPTV